MAIFRYRGGGALRVLAVLAMVTLPLLAATAAEVEEYRLGPGDKLLITVFGHKDLSGKLGVDSAGRISIALLGEIAAAGLTAVELQESIARALDKDFIVNPRVSVEVTDYRPFFILGQVKKPGSYPFVAGLTVRMAVALAGGFTRRARENPVQVIRGGDPEQRKVAIGPGARIQPGDTIEVDRRLF